jgi:hypothetical protein
MLTLTQLNIECRTNPKTSLSLLAHLGPNLNYYNPTNGLGCYSCPFYGLTSIPRQHTIYIIEKRIPRISTRCRDVSWDWPHIQLRT